MKVVLVSFFIQFQRMVIEDVSQKRKEKKTSA